jgi:hypothetical protein
LADLATRLRLVATIGLHSSASTWVFNVVRELLIASFGEAQVLALYADEVGQLPPEHVIQSHHVVIKSHHGSGNLTEWLESKQTQIFLSVRDPRDAAVSMCLRFKTPLAITSGWIAADCDRILRLSPANDPVLRYEDRFFEDIGAVRRLADALDLACEPCALDSIFERYRTEAVRLFAQALPGGPPARQTKIGPFIMDKVTHINERHIGDARSGKWRELPESTRTKLTEIFAAFIERFGYQ